MPNITSKDPDQILNVSGTQVYPSTVITDQKTNEDEQSRSQSDINRDVLSVFRYMTKAQIDSVRASDAVQDVTVPIQKALSYANANGFKRVHFPAGVYKVSATLQPGRMSIKGDGDGTRIRPTITNGDPVFEYVAGTNFFRIEDIRIDSNINGANFIAGSINAQNCIGIKVASNLGTGTYSARFDMRNVTVFGCKVGYDIYGFLCVLDNVWALKCETGLIGNTMNAADMCLRFEECRKDYSFVFSSGLNFKQLVCEGGTLQSGLLASTIDDCHGVVFTAAYFEQTRNVPFVIIGGTTMCRGVEFLGGTIGFGSGASVNYDIFPIAFDKVDGFRVGGRFVTGSHHNLYSTTTNSMNPMDTSVSDNVNVFGPHDNSKRIGPARNLFSNPNFDMWFRGWPTVTVTRGVITKETTLKRSGENAVKFTINSGQTSGSLNFIHNDSYLGVRLRGKTVTLYAWVWVPNTADFDPAQLGSQKAQPYVGILTDGTGGTTTISGTHHTVRGAWNLMYVSTTVPADATRIDTIMGMLIGTGTSSGSEMIVLDSMYLVEGTGKDVQVRNGWIAQSDLIQTIGIGGKMVMRSTAAPSDADLTHEVGDRVEFTSPTAGGYIGAVCTGAGSPGTFKNYGAILA